MEVSSSVSSSPSLSVAVVGAGIIGLSVATHLLERFSNKLTVITIADKFSPDTISSDRSGGVVSLVPGNAKLCQGDHVRLTKWVKGTLTRLESLYSSKQTDGIMYLDGYRVTEAGSVMDEWWKDIFHYRSVDQSELDAFRIKPDEGCNIISFATYIVSCPIYLPWLMKRFTQLGGVTEQRKVHDLSELSSYDIVINCTGLGARELANDQQVYPLRGHIVSVSAPWVKQFCFGKKPVNDSTERMYIIPHKEEIILGGTNAHDKDQYDDSTAFERILKRCRDTMPSLANAQVLRTWVGARPMRKGGVRLEREGGSNVIHCYGHGHYGITLSWGCAEEVGDIVNQMTCNAVV